MNIHLRVFATKIKALGLGYSKTAFFTILIALSFFTTPLVFSAPVTTNGITIDNQLSTDGNTVTFTITGVPTGGADVVFSFNYHAANNVNYAGGVASNVAVRAVGMPSTQIQTYIFSLPSDPLITAGTLSKDDISYELHDASGQTYSSGTFHDVAPIGPVVPPSGSPGTTTQVLTGGLIGCDGVVVKCGWAALVAMVNTAIRYVLYLMVPLAAIMFAWAGVLLLTKGSSEEARTKAKGIFINVVIGIVVALAAFLIIKTILDALGVSSGWRIFTQ